MIKLPEWMELLPMLKQEERKVIWQTRDNPDQENVERILAMMEKNPSEELKRAVLSLLEFLYSSPIIERALFTLVKHRDGDVRARAFSIFAIRKSADSQIRELVLRGLNDSDKRVVVKVLEGIRWKKEDWQDHSSRIYTLLQHPDDEIKVEALATFFSMHEDKAWQETHHLFQSFLQHPDHKIRIRALRILSSFDLINPQMKELIIQRLYDSDEEVVIETLTIIQYREWKEVIPMIKSLLQHPNRRVRVKALEVLDSFWEHKLIYSLRKFNFLLRSRLFSRLIPFMERKGYEPAVILQALQALDDKDEMDREIIMKMFEEVLKDKKVLDKK